MSRISASSSLGSGVQAASHALRAAQKKFESASAEVTHNLAASHNRNSVRNEPQVSAAKVSDTTQVNRENRAAVRSGVGKPPNPGPPGGSNPADLTELMLSQDQAGREISANVKTLQAFDQMLEEVTRVKASPIDSKS